jgi:hypothetical protein
MSSWRLRGPELSTAPVISWRSRLEGVTYRFKVSYRKRYDCWDLQVATSTGEVVIDGIRVTEGFPLLGAWIDARLPPGVLTCIDSQNLGAHPTRNDWRERHYFRYDDAILVAEDNELSIAMPEGPPA